MSQPASVLHSVIHPKPPGQGTSVRPVGGANRETEAPTNEGEDLEVVLSVLVENAPVAMAMFDTRMRYVLANRQWISDFGLQNFLPLVGQSQFDVFPNLHPGWRSVYERALQGHVVRSEHDVMPGPQGKSMIFRWEVRPWRRQKDNTVGGLMVTCEKFAALGQPVADPDPAEAQAAAQPSLLESDLPVVICNVQGLITQASKAAGSLALARGIQPGKSHFWEAFAEEQSLGALRMEVLDVLSRTAAPGVRHTGTIKLRDPGQESPQAFISWTVSRLHTETSEAEGPPLLLVGVPGVETPPVVQVVQVPAPVMEPPPPAHPPVDAALQLENRQLEEQLAGTAKELRVLQDLEKAYKRRELRQRDVLDSMPCGLIVLDERGRPTFHNAQVRALFGRELHTGETVEDWLMQACLDQHHRAEVSSIWRESVWRRQLTKVVSLSTADGLVKDLEFRPTPLGQTGLLLTIHDVTDTCRLEEMLRSTEAKFRALLHESPLAAVLTDITGSIFEANAAAEKLLGHPKAELRRMGIDEWLAPESASERQAEHQRMATGRLTHGELKAEVASGPEQPFQPVQMRMAAVYDSEGRVHSMIHYLQPQPPPPPLVATIPLLVHVTPVEPPAAAAPAPLASPAPRALSSAPRTLRPRLVPLLSTNGQGRVDAWTEEAATLFGHTAEEAIGRPLHQWFRPSDPTGFYSQVLAQLGTANEPVTWSWFGKNASRGSETFRLVAKDDGQLSITLLQDNGEEVIPEEEEQPAAAHGDTGNIYIIEPSAANPWPVADLEREQLLLTEAHHRIKNHLQIISSLLNLQSNNLEDVTARQALRSSQNRVRAIAALHQHLYQLSLGRETSLQEFADELVSRLRECYDAPVDRVAVAVQLQQCEVRDEWHMPLALILNEAISNAFKHAFPDGRSGTINVLLTATDHDAHLTIQDDGVGLPEGFDGSAGAGLGLKVIGVFAEQMQGQVSVENITDRGLIFDLRFPIGCVDN